MTARSKSQSKEMQFNDRTGVVGANIFTSFAVDPLVSGERLFVFVKNHLKNQIKRKAKMGGKEILSVIKSLASAGQA